MTEYCLITYPGGEPVLAEVDRNVGTKILGHGERDSLIGIGCTITMLVPQQAQQGAWEPVPDGEYTIQVDEDHTNTWKIEQGGRGATITDCIGDYVIVDVPKGWRIERRIEAQPQDRNRIDAQTRATAQDIEERFQAGKITGEQAEWEWRDTMGFGH